MILAAHQLHYLPWLRYFHKMASADTFVILDDIQFNKNGWQNRNKIKTAAGELILTVPVLQKFAQPLSQVRIDVKQPWQRKHWGALQSNYQKAPHFAEHAPFFRRLYPAPQKAPSVKTGMNGKRLPEGFFPKATGVNPWCGVYRYQRPLASWNFYGTIPGKWTKSEVS